MRGIWYVDYCNTQRRLWIGSSESWQWTGGQVVYHCPSRQLLHTTIN